MRIGFRYRLLLLNVMIVAVPLAGISFARFHEREVLRAMEDDMIHQAQLLRAALLSGEGRERSTMLARAARDTGIRIRLVDERGRVVADSAPAASVDLRDRREIRAALAGRYGAATRILEDGRLYLFSALPVQLNGRVTGAIYVMRSTKPAKLAMLRLRGSLLRVTGAALLITAVLSLVLASAFEKLAKRLDERARQTAELCADISHEFKSPLTSMRGAAELLLDGAHADPAARARFLANILADSKRLDRLVSRLLELSRIDHGGAVSARGPALPGRDASSIDQAATAPELLRWDELARAAAGQRATVEYASRRRIVRGRREQLAAALANLIDNAAQHAAPGTAVTVRVSDARGGLVRTAVHNHGIPIRPANLARVWDRFFTTRAERGGTGLGLAIVRAVAESHGGGVGASSDEAAGTTFWFDLP